MTTVYTKEELQKAINVRNFLYRAEEKSLSSSRKGKSALKLQSWEERL